MSQFAGLVVQDQEGNPEEFSEEAATGIIECIKEPEAEMVKTDTGTFYIILK